MKSIIFIILGLITATSSLAQFRHNPRSSSFTVATMYGDIFRQVTPRLGVNLSNGRAWYKTSAGAVSGYGYYRRLQGGNIVGSGGVATRHAGGWLSASGKFYPDNGPYVFMGGSRGRSTIKYYDRYPWRR